MYISTIRCYGSFFGKPHGLGAVSHAEYDFRSRLAVKRGKTRGKIVNRIARSHARPNRRIGNTAATAIAGESTGIVTVGGRRLRRMLSVCPT